MFKIAFELEKLSVECLIFRNREFTLVPNLRQKAIGELFLVIQDSVVSIQDRSGDVFKTAQLPYGINADRHHQSENDEVPKDQPGEQT